MRVFLGVLLLSVVAATGAREIVAPGAAGVAPGRIEVAFSPGGGATALVVKVIDGARSSVRLAGYSFTSDKVARSLLGAHRRAVDVQVVVDKSQASERYTAATFLANLGVPVRIDRNHKIMHHKFLVVDGKDVQTGSFNYTSSAENGNAENVLVVWGSPDLAALYTENWREHWEHSLPFAPRY